MTKSQPSDSQCHQRGNADIGSARPGQSLFDSLFEGSTDPMCLLDPLTGAIVEANAALVALLRAQDRGHVLGRTPVGLSPQFQPDGRNSLEIAERLFAPSDREWVGRFEWSLQRLDGSQVRVECTAMPLRGDGQELRLLLSRDITERQETERALRENQRVLASITENLREAVYRSGPDHDLIHVNAAYLKLFAYGSFEEVRSVPRERLYARPADRVRLLARLAETGQFQPLEIEFMRKDGSSFWGLISSRAILNTDTGRVLFHVGSIVDITDRRAAELELRQANQLLEERVSERTAALQLANGLLRDEVKERQRREQVEHALYRISEAIHLAADLGHLYPLIHAAVRELMPARNFYIALHDPETDLHHFVYHVDELDATPPPRKLRTGMTAHVFRSGRALLADRDSMLRPAGSRAGQDWSIENGTPSAIWLGVPLVASGRTLGVMVVQEYHDERAFGEAEKRILTFVGEQTAMAISRKRAEQALRESEARHRALFEATSQGVLLQDGQTFIAANPAAARMLGYPADRLIGRGPADFSAPIQAGGQPAMELADLYLQRALSDGSTRFDWIGRRADGSEFPMEVTLTAIELGGRRIVQAVINDITERQRQLQVAHALYRISEAIHEADTLDQLYPLLHAAVAQLMPARNFYIAIHDPATGLLSFPYYVDERDARPPARPLGKGFTEYVMQTGEPLLADPEVTARIREAGQHESQGSPAALWLGVPLAAYGRTFGAMAVQDYENPHAYGDDEKRLMMFVAEQTGLAIARKRAELELRRALEREQELGRMKSNFTSLVSHEFRTPLGVIGSSAEILRDYFEQLSPEERVEHLNTIWKHTRRMGNLMEEVLLLSRFDAGRTEFQAQQLDLREFCGRVVAEVISATGRCCPVDFELDDALIGGAADDRLLRHILINLLVNAVKYSEPGAAVYLRVHRSGPDAMFEIRDCGIGIPEADREWVFQAFHRGSNVGHRPGTGLGLVIVKRCVDLHGGRIELESEVGRGTTMRVRIPMFAPAVDCGAGGMTGV